MKKIIWIGSFESDEEFINKTKKGLSLASAQISQKNIINGIEEVTNQSINTINGSVLPHFPVYSDFYVKTVYWNHCLGAEDVSVGYLNLKYLNRFTCKKSMVNFTKKYIKEKYNATDELIVLAYSMRNPIMSTACIIKKIFPNTKIYLIVTDLPQFMDLNQSKIKKFLKKLDWIKISNLKEKFDGFILYSEEMANYLSIQRKNWILMEGLFDEKEINKINKSNKNSHKKVIMYSGSLDEKYGLKLLIDAFMEIENQNYQLWLTGKGNTEKYIIDKAIIDNRIKYFGFIHSRDELLRRQSEASVFVNMRLPSEEASKYCFPSKLFEYMVSGRPVISFDIKGIPFEYRKYLVMIKNENIRDIKNTLIDVLSWEDGKRNNFAMEAKNFIMNNKLKGNQAKKIINFITK